MLRAFLPSECRFAVVDAAHPPAVPAPRPAPEPAPAAGEAGDALAVVEAPAAPPRLPPEATWIDLFQPTRDEEKLVEQCLGIEVPTREEMQEIEPSSRLYQERGATFVIANVIYQADSEVPGITPVTFVLAGNRLVTIRYAEPKSFRTFSAHSERQPLLCATGAGTLIGLLDAIVDRIADVIERTAADLDTLSKTVFARHSGPAARRARTSSFEEVLRQIGHKQDLTAKARDSLVSLGRLLAFVSLAPELKGKEVKAHLKTLTRDVSSLTDQTGFLSNNINFLLDAAMGMINIEQNAIIKIFSVAAVVFLPPTLVASIYGMNFQHMPELEWALGYPWAILLMVLSAVLPYWWFKRKGWL
jgi:magnesium transporter